MSTALAEALRRAADLQRKPRVRPVVLPTPEPVRQGLSRRPAEQVPVTLRPVTVLRPAPETSHEVRLFVVEEFREAAKKRERR